MISLSILYLESNEDDFIRVQASLTGVIPAFQVISVANRAAYLQQIKTGLPHVILSAWQVGDLHYADALQIMQAEDLDCPFILLVDVAHEAAAAESLTAGVADYLVKDRLLRLPFAITTAIDLHRAINNQSRDEALLKATEVMAQMGSLEVDLLTGERAWSVGMEYVLGYEPGQVKPSQQMFADRLHPDDRQLTLQAFDQGANNGGPFELTYRILLPDGTVKNAHSRLTVVKDASGKPLKIKGFIQDITAATQYQQQITGMNSELKRLLVTIEEVLFARDMVTDRLILISPACYNIYGHTPEEFMADQDLWAKVMHPDDQHILKENVEQFKQGKTLLLQYRVLHHEKGERWAESKVIPTLDKNGILVRLDGVTRDITEQRLAEFKLLQSEQRLHAMIENSGEIVSVANYEGQIIYTSNNVTKVLGYTREEYTQVRFASDFIHPDDKAKQLALFIQTRENPGVVYPFSWRLKHARGHWVWVEGKVTNLMHVPAINGMVANFKDVTEQRLAEEKLALSEARYRRIAETAQEGIWMLDDNSVTIFVNKKMCDMLEYPAAEVIGRHNYDFKDEVAKLSTINRIQNRKKGEIETHESTFVTKTGKKLICLVSTNSIFDPDGSYVGTLAMITDITELKAQQEALQRSEANLSAVIENTNDLVYSLDKDLRFITFNNRFKQAIKTVYGFDTEYGVNAMSLIATLSEKAGQEWKAIYALALAGETQQFVNEYPVPDGKVYLSYSVNPIRDGNEVIGLSVFSRDITQQRADELALIKSEANLRSVFENTDLAIILYDLDLVMLSFNTNAVMKTRRILGKELEVGRSAFDYFPEERRDTIMDMLARIKGGEVITYELEYHMLDGHKEWLESRWFAVTNQQQEVVGVILTLNNVTDKKQAELERETMTADILRRNRHLEQFTYIISHNVRAPVANIKGLTDLLIKMELPEPECLPIVEALASSSDQLDKVIIDLNQILQVDKQLHENKERIVLQKLVEQVTLELQTEIRKFDVSIKTNFTEAHELFTVKSYSYSIFHNLITNSIKYRQEAAPEIEIQSGVADGKVIIWYQDNGRGIDLERYGSDLFGLYKRFDFSVEGKGMGLFMVKQQIQSLGGNITVSSQPGQGTKFQLEFPL